MKKVKAFGIFGACAMMVAGGGFLATANLQNSADAIYSDDTTSYVKVDEIWDGTQFDADNLNTLLQYVTGDADASVTGENLTDTMSELDRLATIKTTSADIRGKGVNDKSNEQDVIVRFGGLDWQVVYLSKDRDGNDILTLWLSSSKQDAWNERLSNEGLYFGFIDGSLYSDWALYWSTSTLGDYPINMYGTSYIRAVTLNNGGAYATGDTTLSEVWAQDANNVFAMFTMDNVAGSVTDFLVTPSQVAWQETESAVEQGIRSDYILSNEAYGLPSSGNNYSIFNYIPKSGYTDWANDTIWLPSVTETGYDNTHIGIWDTSTEQRRNISSSTSSVGSVGSESGDAYRYSWLRSTTYNSSSTLYNLSPSGSSSSSYAVNRSHAVRPALHLNLNSALLNAVGGESDTSADLAFASVSLLSLDYDGEEIVPNISVKFNGVELENEKDFTMTFSNNFEEDFVNVTILGIGNYYGFKEVNLNTNIYSSNVYVSEIWDGNKFNENRLNMLLQYVTGLENADISNNLTDTMNRLEYLASGEETSAEIRTNVVNFKNSNQDVVVQFGGLEWEVVYLSKDRDGNDILTLWLNSSQQDAWAGRAVDEGEFYGFVDGSLYSDFSANWTRGSWSGSLTYPSGMYGSSYIRSVTLNCGGNYATDYNRTQQYEQNSNSVFAMFTMDEVEGSVTDFLVTPSQVAWQETESSYAEGVYGGGGVRDYVFPNEAYGTPSEGILPSEDSYTGTKYTRWSNDYLWLPSATEVGTSNIIGIWKTSTEQRMDASFTVASTEGYVGSGNINSSYLRNGSWLRSADTGLNYAKYVSYNGIVNVATFGGRVSSSYAVRPALHLNLSSAILSLVGDESKDLANAGIEEIENQEWTGEEVEPNVVVNYDGVELQVGIDYSVEFFDNVDMGVASFTISAVEGSGYVGTKTSYFVIGEEPDVANATIVLIDSYEWTGSAVVPQGIVVDYYGSPLELNAEYSLEISNNTNLGTASLTITGKGFYSGTQETTFEIVQRSLETVGRISVSPLGDHDFTGDWIEPNFTVTDTSLGTTLQSGTDFTYQFSDNTNVGMATLTLTGIGNYAGTISRTFYINPISLSAGSFTLSRTSFEYSGQTQVPYLSYVVDGVPLVRDRDFEIEYRLGTTDGTVVENPTEVGTYYIVLTGKGNYTGGNSTSFQIVRGNIVSDSITLSQDSYTFNQQVQKPDVTVEVQGRTLMAGEDFSLEIRRGSATGEIVENPTEAGTYYVVVTAMGDSYTGTAYKTFTISTVSIAGATLTLADAREERVYAGSPVTVEVESLVTDIANGSLVVPESGYDISYVNNEGAGTATVTLTGKGSYVGSVSADFVITPGTLSSVLIDVDGISGQGNVVVPFKGSAYGTPTVTVFDTNAYEVNANDFSVTFSSADFTNAGVIRVTVVPKQNGTYLNYRGTVNGTITIERLDISELAEVSVTSTHTYDGKEQIPNVSVMLDGRPLSVDTDFSLTYANNTNAGEATVFVTFRGNFQGVITETFEIAKRSFANVTAEIAEQEFSGSQIRPDDFAVFDMIDGERVQLGAEDFEISGYGENLNVGVGTVTIAGTENGNFSGSATLEFDIVAKALTDDMISVSDVEFDGEVNEAEVVVRFGGTTLEVTEDYLVEYQGDTVNVGQVTVVISAAASGNFSGTAQATYQITPRSISGVTIQISGTYTYNREKQTVNFTAVDEELAGVTLTTADFDVSYENNTNAGSATLILTGKGNYEGSASENFTIERAQVSAVTLASTGAVYDGEAQDIEISSVTATGGVVLLPDEYSISYSPSGRINAGNVTVTVSAINSNFTGNAQTTFVISPAVISGVSLVANSVIFDGNSHVPQISRVWTENGLTLQTSNFNISYTRGGSATSDFTSQGTIVVSISSNSSNFVVESAVSANFTIGTKNIADGDVTIRYFTSDNQELLTDQTYIGQSVYPVITFDGDNLTRDVDFSYTITDSEGEEMTVFENAGDFVLTITGEGNFSGLVVKQYKVVAAQFTLENISVSFAESATKTYTGSAVTLNEEDVTLTYEGRRLEWGVDFDLYTGEYDLATGTDLEENIINVVGGYYSNINAGRANVFFVGLEGGNFTGDVICLIFEIKPLNLNIVDSVDVVLDADDLVYDTTQKEPSIVSITVSDASLTENLVLTTGDYSFSYSNNINAGSNATVTIRGLNNFEGIISENFTIAPQNIANATVATLMDVTYNAGNRQQTVSLSYGSLALVSGRDFVVEYQRNAGGTFSETADFVNAGTIRILITGQNNFDETTYVEYEIMPLNLSSSSVSKDGTLGMDGRYALSDETYSMSEIKKTPNITFAGHTLGDGEVSFAYNTSNFVDVANGIVITATGEGNFAGSVQFLYNIIPADISNDLRFTIDFGDVSEFTYTGEEIELQISIMDGQTDVTSLFANNISYSNNINVAYSGNDVTTGASVTVKGTGNYFGSVSHSFKINPLDLNAETVTKGQLSDVTYSGSEQRPVPTLSLGDYNLKIGTDFTVLYSSADLTNVQTDIALTMNGTGNFGGTLTGFSFDILQANFSDSERFEVNFDSLERTFTGEGIELSFTIRDLTRGENLGVADFSTSYQNNTNVAYSDGAVVAGATLTFRGEGNYAGTISQQFKINPKSLADEDVVVVEIENQGYTGLPLTPPVTIQFNSKSYGEGADTFAVNYENNTEFGEATVTITGQGNFTGETETTFIITNLVVSDDVFEVRIASGDHVFTGSEIKPEISVFFKNTQTELDEENYSVVYQNNINAGRASITVIFDGNYLGTLEANFTISSRDISEAEVAPISDFTYDGQSHYPELSITLGEYSLTSNDYYVRFSTSDFVNVQTVTVTINGTGNFKGTTSAEFDISPKDLSDDDIVLRVTQSNLEFTGSEIQPAFTVTYGFLTLENGVDFDAEFSNNTNAGQATLIIKAKSDNFTAGSQKSINFEIAKKELEYSMIADIEAQHYTGYEIKPHPVVTYGDITLKENVDFEVSYSNNTNYGNAIATISAPEDGNFFGSISKEFNILRVSISGADVSGYELTYTFNDTEIKPEFVVTVDGIFEEGGMTLKPLTEGEDYVVQYADDNVNVGTKRVMIVGQNNFNGDVSISYTINSVDLSNLEISLDGFEEELPYDFGENVEQNFVLKIGEFEIGADNFLVSYDENVNAGNATMTITPVGSNLTGTLVRYFEITKIDPILNNLTGLQGFVGEIVSNIVVLGDGDTDGTFVFTPNVVVAGENEYAFTFTPNDTDNFNIITEGSVTIFGVDIVIERIEAQTETPLVDGNVFNLEDVTVYAIYNDGHSVEIFDFTTSLANGEVLSAENEIVVSYYVSNTETTYTCGLNVLRRIIQGDGFTADSPKGFADDVEIVVEEITDGIEIYEMLSGVLENINDVDKIYVVSLSQNDQPYVSDGITITFNTSAITENFIYYVLRDGNLVEVTSTNGTISLGTTSEAVLVLMIDPSSNNLTIIIVGVIIGVMAVIIVVLVIVNIVDKKKRKKLSNKSNVGKNGDGDDSSNTNDDNSNVSGGNFSNINGNSSNNGSTSQNGGMNFPKRPPNFGSQNRQ